MLKYMKNVYSINIIKQAYNVDDGRPRHSYENQILLYHLDENIQKEELIRFIKADNLEEPYEVVEGTSIQWAVAKVVDVFEVLGLEGQFDEGQEVYSRFFPDDHDLAVILEKYFPDYVFEDAEE